MPRRQAKEKPKSFLQKIGPGFITGASDDDPSGIATYAQTGAQFGFSQLWLALFSIPFMTAVQEMCGRIGLVTGTGLAGNMRRHYPKAVLYAAVTLLFVANTINIGADLGAMASSAQLVVGLPFEVLLLLMTALTLVLEIFMSYRQYARFLKYLTLSLFAYVATAFIVRQPWGEVAIRTLVPNITWSGAYLSNVVAIMGTTISPYLFFWQAGEEVEEEIAGGKLRMMGLGRPRVTDADIRNMRQDTAIGMVFSNFVMFFVILTAASTLGRHGVTAIATATDAAQALRPLAGDAASLLFALGIVGTGLLAVPVLAGSASYALSETLEMKEGLYLKFYQAHGFYGAISIATVVGLITNFIHVPPFTMLYYAAILNGIAAPPLLVMILLIANNPTIMGKHTNSPLSNVLGWVVTGAMTIIGIALIVMLLR